jgi:predicted dehydrogenase
MKRIGIAGIGQIAGDYMSIFGGGMVDGAALAALSSRNTGKAEETAKKCGLSDIRIFDSYTDMLDSGLVDGVIITTPHTLHAKMAEEAIVRGISVLVDKPLGVSAIEVERLVTLADGRPDLATGVMVNRRANNLYRKVRDIVRSGSLGELRRSSWQITNLYRTYAYYRSGSWRGSWKTEAGGVLMNQAVHQFDLLLWIAGMPESISAYTAEGLHRPVTTENDATLVLFYENGATGTFTASTHECPGTNRLELSFERGQIVVEDDSRLTVRTLSMPEEDFARTEPGYFTKVPWTETIEEIPIVPNKVEQATTIQNFVDTMEGIKEIQCSFRGGRDTVRAVNAAYLSAWTGRPVAINFDPDEYEVAYQRKVSVEEGKNAWTGKE